ncbi:acyltransferase family protein [Paraclostridium bifermentans]|uniref:acyltransferase family protein n=1 Tax=Paraclostridium bifermentans TaxID=1490 RepID=UPI00359C9D13
MNQKLSEKIKILGFLMTCFMIFYHCGALDNSYALNATDAAFNTFLSNIFDVMGVFVMSHFFAVTGFLLFRNLNLKNYPTKIKRRVFSLLIPYVTWQVIITLKLVLQGQYIFSLKDFLYKTFYLVMWPSDGAMWYVYAVFLLALVSPIFLLIFKNKNIGWGLVVVIIIFLSAQRNITNEMFVRIVNHGYVGNILFYFPSYLVGAFYGKFYDELHQENRLVYIFSVLFIAFLLEGTFPGFLSNTTIKLMPIMGLFLLPVIPSLKDKWVYRLTFLMYAMHQPLIDDIRWRIYDFYEYISIPVSVSNILTRVIILISVIILSTIIYVILNKFAPKALTALTGGRD